jgi:hypothetical protein
MAILDEFGNAISYRTFAHSADTSTRRGPQFAVRNDDIDRLIPLTDRKTLMSLSNRLTMNMGVLSAVVGQKADWTVGEAWLPSYQGPDADNGKIVAKFIRDFWFPQCEVRGGMFDWWKMLELSSIGIDVLGGQFLVMILGKDGFPRIQMIPYHRCESSWDSLGGTTVKDGEWKGYRINDGIIYYSSGRPAAYNFNIGKDGEKKYIQVPATDVIHLYDPRRSEQERGFPSFSHALESMKMALGSIEDERIRTGIISRLHLLIYNESGGPDIDEPSFDQPAKIDGQSQLATQYFPGGIRYMMDGKERMESIKHDNPGPTYESFQDRLFRDAIIGAEWSYNVWKGSGQGTDARAEVVKCRRAIVRRRGILWHAARRIIPWVYSAFVAQGRIPKLQNPFAWDFSSPPRLTVDDGREAKMEMELVRAGLMNPSEPLAGRGLSDEEFLYERARHVFHRKLIPIKVADELNAIHGTQITIEERDMFMHTANEMPPQVQTDAPDIPDSPEKPDPNEDDTNS